MMTRRRVMTALIVVAAWVGVLWVAPHARATVPAELSNQEFWGLTESLSEPNGSFRSDNFLSNEIWYQDVIPKLRETIKPGGVYLGVGPEQNFPYIAALRPKMAFIIDIRRGNLHEQLLYKALFEMSTDRADFLSKLFSRKRPAGLGPSSTVNELFAAYDQVAPSDALYQQNLKAVLAWLTQHHGFKLSDDDVEGIGYVYHDAFFVGGPQLNYSMGSSFGFGRGGMPDYEDLMLADDGAGKNLGYLASEETFDFLKAFEAKNLLVPVVGNFGGPKAIRAVGAYVRDHGGTVTTFYLSNVEQYLIQQGIWDNFCRNVASLPLDGTSTFIFSGRGSPDTAGGGFGRGGFGGGFRRGRGLMTQIRPMVADVEGCATTTARR